MKLRSIIFCFCALFSLLITAQDNQKEEVTKRIYTTKRLQKVPVIDGDISDDAWDVVEWSSDFTEKNPDEGTPQLIKQSLK